MMRVRYIYLLLWMAVVSCASDQNEEAEFHYRHAVEAFQAGSFQQAKLSIDSVRIDFPKAYKVIRKGQMLKRKIELAEARSSFEFYSDQIPLLERRLQSSMKGFRFEKNEKYGSLGLYVLPSQTTERLLINSHLRCGVDETGVLYMESLYVGSVPIEHTSLVVKEASGSSVQSAIIPYDGGTNYRASLDGIYREVIRYVGDKTFDFMRFVVDHRAGKMSFVFEGKRKSVIACDQATVEAFRKTMELSTALSDYRELQELKSKTEQRIYSLEKLIRTSEKELEESI